MTCSQCWTTVPSGKGVCPRCGAKITGAPPSFLGLLKSYPWLAAVLALSVLVTLWAATRRAPAPPPAPPAPVAAPVAAAPAPEPEPEPTVWPVVPPAEEPAAAPPPAARSFGDDPPPPPGTAVRQNPDGTWSSGPAVGGR